jgi:hypothetical protein
MIALLAGLLGVGGIAGIVLRLFGFGAVKKAASKIPPQVWLFGAIAIAIGLAAWFLDHRGYERAKEQDRLHELERQELARAIVGAIDKQLDTKLAAIGADTNGKIQTIDTEGRTFVQPIITREILRDRNLADPNRCLSPGLLSAINAARGYLDEHLAGAEDGPASPPGVPAAGKGHGPVAGGDSPGR